jgi:uncharacterized protein YbjT (DUF2867 family)
MSPTILVTGSTGTVGSELVKRLVSQGVPVRAGVHTRVFVEKTPVTGPVEVVNLDYAAPSSLAAALEGVEKAFLLTPVVLNQAEIVKRLVDAALKMGVQHIVRLSAAGAGDVPGIQLGRWHREAEMYVEASGIPFTHLRPGGFMQNFINYQGPTIRSEGKFYLPVAGGAVNYIDARDIAEVAARVLAGNGHQGKAYTLTGPEAITHFQVAECLSQATGRAISYVDVPEQEARKELDRRGWPGSMVSAVLELYAVYKAGLGSGLTDSVERLIGRKPRSFAQFAADYAFAFR